MMTFEEAKQHARQGVKVTHNYFSQTEYMTMKGNIIIFEDGVEIFANDWLSGKDYLLDGWSIFNETNQE